MMMTITDMMSSLDLPLLLTWMPSPANTSLAYRYRRGSLIHIYSAVCVFTRGPQCSFVLINSSTKDESESLYMLY